MYTDSVSVLSRKALAKCDHVNKTLDLWNIQWDKTWVCRAGEFEWHAFVTERYSEDPRSKQKRTITYCFA